MQHIGQMMRMMSVALIALTLVVTGAFEVQAAGEFRIALTQAESGAAKKYRPLEEYLKGHGVNVQFVATKDYTDAALMFAAGKVDGMFAGSGVAGSMIIKEVATPLLRPVGKDGNSTYWASIVAPQGTAPFDGKAEYFRNKKVLASPLASSGEFFFRSLPGIQNVGATFLPAANHGAAIDALSKGAGDFAIVKNWVWEANKGKYPTLTQVGQDKGQNPDGTLIIANKADKAVVAQVEKALLGMNDDKSPAAEAVREAMNMTVFIPTTAKDFEHTLALLRSAGVTKGFEFKF